MKRVAHHLSPYGELAPGPGFAMPERLVGLGFRHWLQGYRTGDIASWEKVWCSYSSAMGAAALLPLSPFSITTATAIRGSSSGANATNNA